MSHQRETIISLIADAQANGARQKTACGIVDILPKTLQRWVRAESLRDGRLEPIHTPVNKLTDLERQRILTICNEKQYSRLPHSKIVPILAYKGVYVASEASFYRVLKATEPNQVYSWEITYLPSQVTGVFFYFF